MRLDVFLKLSRLEPRRTIAQQMCEGGAVKLNGVRAKSSREVREGDLLSIRNRGRIITVRVLRIPLRPPRKSEAASLYETLMQERLDDQL
jgi:ribosomal 50S subunit-recycling heat shock protein